MKTMTAVRLALACVLLVAGCGSKDNSGSTPITTRGGRGVALTELGMPPSMKEASALPFAERPVDDNARETRPRMVIKTAQLMCEVADYDRTFAEIQRITNEQGGFVVGSSVQGEDDGRKSGTVTLRVPSKNFEATLEALKKLATTVESEGIQGNDVTEEFYDLTARLENKRKAERRFQEILKAAKTSREILEVEQALSNIREEIDRLEGRKRYMTDQAEMSTITLTIHEPRPIVTTGTKFRARLAQALGRGVERGVNAFVNGLSTCIAVIVAVIPFALVLLILFWIGRRFYRRGEARRASVAETKKAAPGP